MNGSWRCPCRSIEIGSYVVSAPPVKASSNGSLRLKEKESGHRKAGISVHTAEFRHQRQLGTRKLRSSRPAQSHIEILLLQRSISSSRASPKSAGRRVD